MYGGKVESTVRFVGKTVAEKKKLHHIFTRLHVQTVLMWIFCDIIIIIIFG